MNANNTSNEVNTMTKEELFAQQQEVLECIKPHFLMYDIPENAEIENPSGELRSIAVRIQLSCWVIPKNNIPWNLLNELTTAGATWDCVEFSATDAARMIALVTRSLQKDIKDAVESSEKSLENAAKKYADGDYTGQKFENAVNQIRRRTEEKVNSLMSMVSLFKIDTSMLAVTSGENAVRSMRMKAYEKAGAYAEASKKLRELTVSGAEGMANGADANTIPAGIMADFLRENDQEEMADTLEKAFAE